MSMCQGDMMRHTGKQRTRDSTWRMFSENLFFSLPRAPEPAERAATPATAPTLPLAPPLLPLLPLLPRREDALPALTMESSLRAPPISGLGLRTSFVFRRRLPGGEDPSLAAAASSAERAGAPGTLLHSAPSPAPVGAVDGSVDVTAVSAA